jgi:hypothetical protein
VGKKNYFLSYRVAVGLVRLEIVSGVQKYKQKIIVTSGQKLQVSKGDPYFFSDRREKFFISQPISTILVPIDSAFNADSNNTKYTYVKKTMKNSNLSLKLLG